MDHLTETITRDQTSLRQTKILGIEGNSKNGRKYTREASKAFGRFTLKGKVLYTCDVNLLKACGNLGTPEEINRWRSNFCQQSANFDDADGVIFNARPGEGLAASIKEMQIDFLYLALSATEIVNLQNGETTTLDEPLSFAARTTMVDMG